MTRVLLVSFYIDVSIWLLNMDEKLAQHKDMNGMTCLQLLSNMPLVFRSQAPSMGTLKTLIYYCTFLSQYSIFPNSHILCYNLFFQRKMLV